MVIRTGMAGLALAGLVATAAGAGMETALHVGMTLTDGNSQTRQANLALTTHGEKDKLGSVRAGVEAGYGESKIDGERQTTLENARAFASARKTLSPRLYAALDGSVLHDDIALIDYRAMLGPAFGAYLVKTEQTALSLDLGLSYIWERVDGGSDDFLALRLAERFDHAISATASFWQAAEYIPRTEDFKDYLLAAELGVEAAMNTRVNLRMVLRGSYDSTPAAGLKRHDLTLVSGVGIVL